MVILIQSGHFTRNFISLCLGCLVIPALFGQPEIDSLLTIAESGSRDTVMIRRYVEIGNKLYGKDPDRAEEIARKALDLSEDLDHPPGIAASYTVLSAAQILRGQYEEAEETVRVLMAYATEHSFDLHIENAYNRLGVIYYYKGDYQKGLETYFEYLDQYEETIPDSRRMTLYNNMGINYERLDEDTLALRYYNLAYDIAHKEENEYMIGVTTGNMGVIHKNAGDLEKAEKMFIESIKFAQRVNNQNLYIDETSNLADVYKQMERYPEALENVQLSLTKAREINDRNGVLKGIHQIGQIQFHLSNYESAIEYTLESMRLADSIGDREQILDIYKDLQRFYALSGDYRNAYEYMTRFSEEKDSVFNVEKTNQINELEIKYQTAEKDLALQSSQFSLERSKRQTSFLVGVLILALLAGIGAYLALKKIISNNRKIAAQDHELQRQKIEALKKENKLLALDAMVTGQEEERKRIANDLHDGLGGLLTSVKVQFANITSEIDKLNELKVYDRANDMLDEACAEVRRIAHNMMPHALIKMGLVSALEDLAENLRAVHGINASFQNIDFKGRIEEQKEIMIYRIAQELSNNVIKHSEAQNVMIQLSQMDQILTFSMEDDGVGFDLLNETGGLGIKSIKSRANYLNATLEMESSPREGSLFSIHVPLS